MIIEGIATTLDSDGQVNVAPMGPIVSPDFASFVFRPFPTSKTWANLGRTGCGVFHTVDDVLLVARAALDLLPSPPSTFPATVVEGRVLEDCCHWYEFEIVARDDSGDRPRFEATVVNRGRIRDMLGFNRAQHAVLEATILATRLHLVPGAEVDAALAMYESAVQKTGGPREREAWTLVTDYIAQRRR